MGLFILIIVDVKDKVLIIFLHFSFTMQPMQTRRKNMRLTSRKRLKSYRYNIDTFLLSEFLFKLLFFLIIPQGMCDLIFAFLVPSAIERPDKNVGGLK